MKVLLDANAYSLLMRGHEEVAELVRRAGAVLFSAVVVGELMYGFRRGTHFERNAADPDCAADHGRARGRRVDRARHCAAACMAVTAHAA